MDPLATNNPPPPAASMIQNVAPTQPAQPRATQMRPHMRTTRMSSCVVRYGPGLTPLTSAPEPIGMELGGDEEVDFFECDDMSASRNVFITCVNLINEAPDSEPAAVLSAYGAAILCFFPDMREIVHSVLLLQGLVPKVIKLPSGADAAQVVIANNASFGKNLILFGQLILLAYKNINAVNYEPFISKRIVALKAHVGLMTNDPYLKAVNSVNKAIIIKNTFGANHRFRSKLISKVIEHAGRPDVMGSMSAYVAQILEWTDMSSMIFILQTILHTNSPILYDPRVAEEIRSLDRAFSVINGFAYPQFFRIMAPIQEQKKLERSNFPILGAVAHKLKAVEQPTVAQFVTSSQVEETVVQSLIDLHNAATNNSVNPNLEESIRYLTGQMDNQLE